jgi:hypothetical protein
MASRAVVSLFEYSKMLVTVFELRADTGFASLTITFKHHIIIAIPFCRLRSNAERADLLLPPSKELTLYIITSVKPSLREGFFLSARRRGRGANRTDIRFNAGKQPRCQSPPVSSKRSAIISFR